LDDDDDVNTSRSWESNRI